jgi:glycosyltransferase involved in cell wall biosynthesis
MKKAGHSNLFVFPVGPLNIRVLIAERIKQSTAGACVTVLLKKEEEASPPTGEGLCFAPFRPLKKLVSGIDGTAAVPFFRYSWHRSFMKIVGLALLMRACSVLLYGEDGRLSEGRADSVFVRKLFFILASGSSFVFARALRRCLPILAFLKGSDSELRTVEENWFILPIYPDLSHHFIFQQVLHLSRLGPHKIIVILKGDAKYQSNYMKPIQQEIIHLAEIEKLGLIALKNFVALALRFPIRLLNTCIELEREAAKEGETLWSLRGFMSPFNPLYGLALSSLGRRGVPKSIHTYGLTFPTNYGLFLSMIYDIPHTATYYIDVPKGIPLRLFELKKRKLKRIVVHTRHCVKEVSVMMGIPVEKISFIPFGTLLDDTCESQEEIGSKEIIAIGRLIPKKGFHHLIEACRILKERQHPVRCLIIGSGQEEPLLRLMVAKSGLEEWVRLGGERNYDDYLSVLKAGRILVQPSVVAVDGDHDGVPSVVLDAMARGLVVVGTRVGGIPEVVRDGENGYLVPPGDAEALADRIENLIQDPEKYRRFSREAMAMIREQYDSKGLAKRMAMECGFDSSSA